MVKTETPKIQVAIIGAGIGGLTLSAALHSFDKDNKYDISIYEASHRITEVGAGVGVWPRTWKILKELGLDEDLSRLLAALPDEDDHIAWEVRKADQTEGVHIEDMVINGNLLGFHRADVQQILLRKSSSSIVHVNRRLVGFEELANDEISLKFQDGSSATCDILIGFDGFKSVVRKGLLAKQGLSRNLSPDPVWTGTVAYRALIKQAKLEEVFPGHSVITRAIMYIGKSKHLLAYPIQHQAGGVLVNVVAFVANPEKENTPWSDAPSTSTCSSEEVIAAYAGWEREVTALIECIEKPTKWPIGDLIPLASYTSGRILIGGDAAHAMPPHQGSGAGQAIEDAYILARLLCHPKATNLLMPKIAEIYSAVRCPEGNRVLAASIETGLLYNLLGPDNEDVKQGDTLPTERLKKVARDIEKGLAWTWKMTAENDVAKALAMLDDAIFKFKG